MPDDPDTDSRTLALLTPRRLVKNVKSLLEASGVWGKRIEPIAKDTDVGGSGLGVGEEMYLVYSTVSRQGRRTVNGCKVELECSGDGVVVAGNGDVCETGEESSNSSGGENSNPNSDSNSSSNAEAVPVGVVGVGQMEQETDHNSDYDHDHDHDQQLCGELRALVRDGHVQKEWVRDSTSNDMCAELPSSPTSSSSNTSPASTTTRLRQAVRVFLGNHPPPPSLPPLENGHDYLNHDDDDVDAVHAATESLIASVPKRWSYYPPLILLPQSAFSSAQWKQYLASLPEPALTRFYVLFTTSIHSTATHLAINAPIPPSTILPPDLSRSLDRLSLGAPPSPPSSPPTANIIRAPLHLTPLHGKFGLPPPALPTSTTLPETLFVSTTQLTIYQTWAPLHTMFSRGNISEKSRILCQSFPGAVAIPGSIVVDLYAGIGYFTFCYLRAGARCVLAWELNPWSVEGLKRGCSGPDGNKFGDILVVKEGEPTPDIDLHGENSPRVIVFNEDNRCAWSRLKDFREMKRKRGEEEEESLWGLGISHVNLGLLPTSRGGWKTAVDALTDGAGGMGWAHVHENVAVEDVQAKGVEILRDFKRLVTEVSGENGGVELAADPFRVKTYAPGVVHVVYDVKVWR